MIETDLPVSFAPHDDRVEVVTGFRFEIVDPAHPLASGLDWISVIFTLCGYNRVTLKPEAHLVARYCDDPVPVMDTYGRGRTAALASKFAPHWGGDFPRWDSYPTFWTSGWLKVRLLD